MTIHIKGTKIIAMDAAHGSETFDGDIVIEGQRIIAMGAALPETQADIVIDGQDKLVTPGFVNAHIHTPEALFRGRYENLPLEMWMTLAYYLIGDGQLAPRAIYLRSMLIAMDALRNGVTFMADDILEPPLQTMETLGSVFQAYDDAGIRANVSGHVIDRPIADTIPFFNEIVPDDLLQQVNAGTPPTVAEYVAFAEEAFSLYHGRADGRLRFMVAPSGPQRCTVELMEAADGLAQENSTAFHTHILESKMQAVAGQEFYGKTLVQYMHDLGLLNRNTTIAHGVWVTDADIALLGEAKCSVVHNTLSNMKLSSGVAPIRKLIDAGVNVALGTDGISTSDTPRMFDAMRAAGHLHNITTADYDAWLSAHEVLHAATLGGAYSALLEDDIGSIEVGKKADLVIMDLRNANFVPLNDARKHLVYSENGSSVETVIVDGEIVVRDGLLTRVDEDALLDEFRALAPELLAKHALEEERNQVFIPYLQEVYKRCAAVDLGIHRYGGANMPSWP
ncbi:MAG: Atrazine chlorohydrolase [Alphaproteobacteria bacterium MarineAlpha10_Bin2]|nr:MAG: Atrazine chlorohydrolase [Alphaproteobacteria bacterium MarineAlpha10_Bin2]